MPLKVGVDFWEIGGITECESCCKVMVEASKPRSLHPTSMSYASTAMAMATATAMATTMAMALATGMATERKKASTTATATAPLR